MTNGTCTELADQGFGVDGRGARFRGVAAVADFIVPADLREILRQLLKIGRAPPGPDSNATD
jgi:hypothetical protein